MSIDNNVDIKRNYVISSIIKSIQNGEYKNGQGLTERALAESLNVSRTPVREAFRCLEEIGLVVSEPHKGVRISTFSHKKISNLYDVREMLEGLAAKSAVRFATPNEIFKLKTIIGGSEDFIKNNDIENLANVNIDFHQHLASMSHNEYLIKSLQQIRENISLLFSESLRQQGRPKNTIEEHWMIFKAIDMGYEDLAETTARLHIRNAYNNVIVKLADKMLID